MTRFQKVARPVLFYTSFGCYLISFYNFYWESKVKQSYEQWQQQQHKYYQLLHEIDNTFLLTPTLEAPQSGFFTSTAKIYKLGIDLLTNEELYLAQNAVFHQQIERKLTLIVNNSPIDVNQSSPHNKDIQNTEIAVTDPNQLLAPSKTVLLEELHQQQANEEIDRKTFLESIKSAPFLLIDPQTKEYRYQPINLLKVGAVCQFLPMAGKFGPLLSAAIITSFFFDLNPTIGISTDQK